MAWTSRWSFSIQASELLWFVLLEVAFGDSEPTLPLCHSSLMSMSSSFMGARFKCFAFRIRVVPVATLTNVKVSLLWVLMITCLAGWNCESNLFGFIFAQNTTSLILKLCYGRMLFFIVIILQLILWNLRGNLLAKFVVQTRLDVRYFHKYFAIEQQHGWRLDGALVSTCLVIACTYVYSTIFDHRLCCFVHTRPKESRPKELFSFHNTLMRFLW